MAEVRSISLDQEAQKILNRNEDYIQERYGGLSKLLKNKLREIEQGTALERELEIEKQRLENQTKKVQKLEKQVKEIKKREEIKDKKDRLQELRERKQRLENQEQKSEEEIREEVKQDYKDSGHDISDPKIQGSMENTVQRRIKRKDNSDEIQNLKNQISDIENEIEELEVELSV